MDKFQLMVVIMFSLFWLNNDAESSNLIIDYKGPSNGVFEGHWPSVNRVQVYVTGPVESFDSYATLQGILSGKPVYLSTNSGQIESLLRALGDRDDHPLKTQGFGYTHHFIFFEGDTNKVMHFRVFTQNVSTNGDAGVYPRSETKFGYSNGNILEWIKVNYATNSVFKEYMERHPLKK